MISLIMSSVPLSVTLQDTKKTIIVPESFSTTMGQSLYEMVFIQKPRKPKCSQQILQKTHKVIANLQNNNFVIIYHYTHTMKIIFITHKT